MTKSLEDEVSRDVASMYEQHIGQEQETPDTTERDERPEETIHIHYFPDAIIILKAEDQARVVDSTPVLPQKTSFPPVYLICGLYLLCMLATLAFQLYCIGNPPNATVTIIPKTKRMSLSGTLQLGRLLHSITISQSQTVPTTGKGHQDAKVAIGTVTLYNGQQTSQTAAQGTVFTSSDGVSIETTQSATIPPGNPSTGYGTATVNAQAVEAGSRGNIQAGDVNTTIAIAVFVKNNQFTGGQDKRQHRSTSRYRKPVAQLHTTKLPYKRKRQHSWPPRPHNREVPGTHSKERYTSPSFKSSWHIGLPVSCSPVGERGCTG